MSGLNAQLGIVDEVTYGVRVAPTRFYELLPSESFKLDRDRIESNAIRPGRRTLHRWNPGKQEVTGGWEIELAPQGLGLLLKHVFGSVQTTGAGPFTHTFTPGTLNGKSMTVQVNKPDNTDTNRPFDYLGVKIPSWEMALQVGELATLKLDQYAAHEDTAQTLATATYPATLQPFRFLSAIVNIAAAEYEVTAVTLKGDNNLSTGRHFIRGTTPERPKEPLEGKIREYTGSIDSELQSLTAYNRFVTGTEAALTLNFNDGASAQLNITTNVRFDGETPKVDTREMLGQSLPFKCVSSTSDGAAITAVLVNGDAAP